jgi:DNA-binding MarR family transcriptional regulator
LLLLGIIIAVSISDAAAREAAPPDDLVERIIDAMQPMVAAQRRVIAKVWHDRSISKLNLHLLMLLGAHGPQPMGQLAALADVALPNLTAIIDRMEDRDLVRRERDSNDRRVVVVHTTPGGAACLEELESVRRQELRRVLQHLSADEQRICLRAMELMSAAASSDDVTTD